CQPQATHRIALLYVLLASRDRSWDPWKDAYAWRHRRRVIVAVGAPLAFPGNIALSQRYRPAWQSGTPGAGSVHRTVLSDWSASPRRARAAPQSRRARHSF